jgi:hypothetical protein
MKKQKVIQNRIRRQSTKLNNLNMEELQQEHVQSLKISKREKRVKTFFTNLKSVLTCFISSKKKDKNKTKVDLEGELRKQKVKDINKVLS